MRGSGGKTVKLRKMLFARQHKLGRGECVGQLARLFSNLPSVDPDESNREQNAEPHAHHVDRGQLQRILGVPRQRVMHENKNG